MASHDENLKNATTNEALVYHWWLPLLVQVDSRIQSISSVVGHRQLTDILVVHGVFFISIN